MNRLFIASLLLLLACSIPQWEVLQDLYSSTKGESWVENDGWASINETNYCSAYGVTCDGTDITKIIVKHNNLDGPLPDSIGDLSTLLVLDLSSNNLHGSVPRTLGNLKKVYWLYLYSNQFTGTIPEECGDMTDLKEIKLHANQLTGNIPESFSRLKNCEKLIFLQNKLSGEFPQWIGNLTKLRAIEFSSNQFYGKLPETIGLCTAFQEFFIAGNLITGTIPESFGNLVNLIYIFINGNLFTGPLPDVFWNLSKLTHLNLGVNLISGPLPPSFIGLTSLTFLGAGYNRFSGPIPAIWGRMSTSLYYIELGSNQLSGVIPETFGNLTNLGSVQLHRNELTGPIPTSFGNLTNLINLQLNGNRLSGTIPQTLGNLTSLLYLDLSNNLGLRGSPAFLTSLPQINSIFMGKCGLFGTIPTITSSRLRELNLEGNNLTGSIPYFAQSIGTLQTLFLNDNQLDGSLDERIGNYSLLYKLDLSNNKLSGPVPQTFSKLTGLVDLRMQNNKLQGDYDFISTLNLLQRLDISGNNFTGPFKSSTWLKLKDTLTYLDMSNNQITGRALFFSSTSSPIIMAFQHLNISRNRFFGPLDSIIINSADHPISRAGVDLVVRSQLRILDVSYNQFEGDLISLGGLTDLEHLDLSNNQLKGGLKNFFNYLPNLQVLRLQNNLFDGALPVINQLFSLKELNVANQFLTGDDLSDFSLLPQLQILNISSNLITAPFPSLEGLNDLSTLDFSNNEIEGEIHPSLFNLRSLSAVKLENNQITGEILPLRSDPVIFNVANNGFYGSAQFIDQMASISTLNLTRNKFSGELPALGGKRNLQIVDVSFNQLNGTVSDFEGLGRLTSVRLNNNAFTGKTPALNSDELIELNLSSNKFSDAVKGTQISNKTICIMSQNSFICPLSNSARTSCGATCVVESMNTAPLHMRIQGELASFDSSAFVDSLSKAANFSKNRIRIDNTYSGSVIVDMTILPPSNSNGASNEGSASRTVEAIIQLSQTTGGLGNIQVLNISDTIPTNDTVQINQSVAANNIGLIVGLSVGISLAVLIVAVVVFIVLQRRRRNGISAEQLASLDLSSINLGAAKKSLISFDELKNLQKIGAGAFGVVYRADWRKLQVAVKQIRAEHVNTEQLRSFLQEVAILQGLRAHPNVVLFLAVTIPPEPLSLVTEYCAGGGLDAYMSTHEVSYETKLRFIRGIALGMLHLHAEKVIHRDLAVRNILLSQHLEPKVGDFGLSREQDEEGPSTTVSAVGPIKWMAPEAIMHRQYSIKSDVFSFGVVIWEILTESEPYPGMSPMDVAIRVARDGQRLEIPLDTPDLLRTMMTDCWEADPNNRPDFNIICAQLGSNKTFVPEYIEEPYSASPGYTNVNYPLETGYNSFQ